MASQDVRLFPEVLQSQNFVNISAIYVATLPVGHLVHPSQVYLVQNLTNSLIMFSQDGINDNFVLPPNGFLLIDAGSNKGTGNVLSFPEGTPLFARGTPSAGDVYLSSFYLG